jgi:hypothetical protein
LPAPIDEIVKRRVIQQWLAGEAREKIIADNDMGAGTVSIIVDEYKAGLDNLDLDSFRELTLEAKKRGMAASDLASFFRLYNFFRRSGAKENEVESFITNINSGYITPGKAIELINQMYDITKSEPVSPDQLANYVKQKLEEKQRIDDEIKEADATLRSKNVNIEAINEHIQLSEELSKYRLSTRDIHKLLNLLLAAKEYKYDPGKIVAKLRNLKHLENKENRLKNSCEMLSKKEAKYKEIIPLANIIWDLHIGKNELISFKIAVNEAAETYGLTPSAAALDVISLIIDHNKKGQLKRELSQLTLQKYAIDRFCSSHSQVIMSLMNLKSHGISEHRILYLNDLLQKNGYNIDMKSTVDLG